MSSRVLPLDVSPLLDLEVADEETAITRVAELLKGHAQMRDEAGFLAAVLERQRINPPVLGSGIALPHARTPLVEEIVCAVARCKEAVAFGPDAVPVRLIFLFGIPPHRITDYLAVTAGLVKQLRRPGVIDGLLTAETEEDFLKLLA